MPGDNDSLFVTRREFYGALALVWCYIALTLGDLLRVEYRFCPLYCGSDYFAYLYLHEYYLARPARGPSWGEKQHQSSRCRRGNQYP
jgi:hypothetical protein